jgi:hypothetical protein
MWMSKKPQTISVIVWFIRLLPHLMVPSYHYTSVTIPVGDLFLLLRFILSTLSHCVCTTTFPHIPYTYA